MTEAGSHFGGSQKKGSSYFLPLESRFKHFIVPKISSRIETYHLTFLTIVWSILNILWGYLAKDNLNFLWLVSLNIVLQYLTDLFDGELGRYRNTGLVKWGYYMDHFLDYVFLCTLVFVGFFICPVGLEFWYLCILSILGGFMVNSFLSFGATNEFEIYHYGFGPTEGRLVLILVNTFIIFFETDRFYFILPAISFCLLLVLIFYTYAIHKKIWKIDMDNKQKLSN